MRQISIQDLKAHLSTAVSQAESGETIVITRHNKPVARLVPAAPQHLYRRKGASGAGLRPAIKPGQRIGFLDALLDDRRGR